MLHLELGTDVDGGQAHDPARRGVEVGPGDVEVGDRVPGEQVAAVRGSRIRLQPANATMEPIYTHPANVEIQGKLVTVIRPMA